MYRAENRQRGVFMAFFGLFKSKQERDMENMFQKMNAMIFPGGEAGTVGWCYRHPSVGVQKVGEAELMLTFSAQGFHALSLSVR